MGTNKENIEYKFNDFIEKSEDVSFRPKQKLTFLLTERDNLLSNTWDKEKIDLINNSKKKLLLEINKKIRNMLLLISKEEKEYYLINLIMSIIIWVIIYLVFSMILIIINNYHTHY